nr:DMT family transporter [uncultured Desulfobacter sp.]
MSGLIKNMFPIGLHYVVLSTLGFALMSACVKYVGSFGIPVFEIVAARALVSVLISYADVKRKHISIWGANKPLLFARGLVGTIALICVYYATTTLPLAEATLLQYTHPVFTSLLAVIFLKEPIQGSTKICLLLSLIGLFAVVSPAFMEHMVHKLPLFSIAVALIGALGSSIAYIIVRKLSQTEDSSVIIFYFPLVALPISLILLGNNLIRPNLHLTFMLILVGLFTQLGQLGLTNAMKTLTAGKASAYSYLQIVFTVLISVFIFKEIPPIWTYIGGALIISGALINVLGPKVETESVGKNAQVK